MSTQEGSGSGPAAYTARTTGPMEEKGRELGRRADEIGARVQTGLRDKAQGVTARKDELKQRVQGGRARIEEHVQTRPLRTLAMAFGAGALLGLVMSRRRPRT
jgi:ElaB/YqjD/DUF883 family membrane-anchored ribosome-binding protein